MVLAWPSEPSSHTLTVAFTGVLPFLSSVKVGLAFGWVLSVVGSMALENVVVTVVPVLTLVPVGVQLVVFSGGCDTVVIPTALAALRRPPETVLPSKPVKSTDWRSLSFIFLSRSGSLSTKVESLLLIRAATPAACGVAIEVPLL